MKDANSSARFILKVEAGDKVPVSDALVSVTWSGAAVMLSAGRGVPVPVETEFAAGLDKVVSVLDGGLAVSPVPGRISGGVACAGSPIISRVPLRCTEVFIFDLKAVIDVKSGVASAEVLEARPALLAADS